jgi:hypothetical protein
MIFDQRIRVRKAELQIVADYFQKILLAMVLPKIAAVIDRESK